MATSVASSWISRRAGREVTGADVTSAVISSGKLAVDLANSLFASYNTPESKLAMSLLLTFSAAMADRQNRNEKIAELDQLQTDFLNSLNHELIADIKIKKNGVMEAFTYVDNAGLVKEFEACPFMSIKLKNGKDVNLYNMRQSSGYAVASNTSAKIAMAIAAVNICFIIANYVAKTAPVATGTFTGDNNISGGITVNATTNATHPNAIQLNGSFVIPGLSGNFTVNDSALHEAHLAACAANETLNASTVSQLLTGSSFFTRGNFTGSAETSPNSPLTESWFTNFDMGASILSSIPINGMTDWFITFYLQQQTSIRDASMSIMNHFKSELINNKDMLITSNISNETIYLLGKTSSQDISGEARKLREDIINHNSNVIQSQLQTQINDITKQRNDETIKKISAEKDFSDERQIHNNTKKEKVIMEIKLNNSEKALHDTQIAIADLSNFYQTIVVKTSEIIAQQVSKTGDSTIADEINTCISQLQKAASEHGKETEANALLEKIAELIKTIPDIAQQTKLSLTASTEDVQSFQPNILKSPSNTKELPQRLDKSGKAVLPAQSSSNTSSNSIFSDLRNNIPGQNSAGAPKTPANKKSGP